jgi:hypothetical protein
VVNLGPFAFFRHTAPLLVETRDPSSLPRTRQMQSPPLPFNVA